MGSIRMQDVTHLSKRGILALVLFALALCCWWAVFSDEDNVHINIRMWLSRGHVVGQWDPIIKVPIVAAAAALLPSGTVLLWAADSAGTFDTNGETLDRTEVATYDPATGAIDAYLLSDTGHNMFCPGLSLDTEGRVWVTGGKTSNQTSVFDFNSNLWSSGPKMVLGRGYHSQATLSNGAIFTIGGSWSGGIGGKHGEILERCKGRGDTARCKGEGGTWRALVNSSVEPMMTSDPGGPFFADNHAWLFAWRNGSVFQAGPSTAMNWYETTDTGGHVPAGERGWDSMNGNAVMFDAVAGNILTLGGAPLYADAFSTSAANIITLDEAFETPFLAETEPMHFPRAFSNSVVLPTGQVFINGGQSWPKQFTDQNSSLIPEMWDPRTQAFTKMASSPVPRNYHSIALLLPDATVLTGGGGLCWTACDNAAANHYSLQVYHPPYLFDPTTGRRVGMRPTLLSLSSSLWNPGSTIVIRSDVRPKEFALIRHSSVTHSVNTDQRRVPLVPLDVTAEGESFSSTLRIPRDSGIVIPGYWMLFAIDMSGVPSVAWTVQIL